MAHSCPDCGYTCHCGGDIDDCCFDDTPEQRRCMCCFVDYDEDGVDDDAVNAELERQADEEMARETGR